MRTINIQIFKRGSIWGENLQFEIEFNDIIEIDRYIIGATKNVKYKDYTVYIELFDDYWTDEEYDILKNKYFEVN
jgi:hypothetical protein